MAVYDSNGRSHTTNVSAIWCAALRQLSLSRRISWRWRNIGLAGSHISSAWHSAGCQHCEQKIAWCTMELFEGMVPPAIDYSCCLRQKCRTGGWRRTRRCYFERTRHAGL